MAWVSVEDQLPPEIDVIFYIAELGEAAIGTYNKHTKRWMVSYSDAYFANSNNWVTHWDVVPDPPETL